MEEYIKNILNIYNLATDAEKADGMTWYNDANAICQRLSDKYKQPLELVCYVMACLSPNNKWHRNIIDTEKLLSLYVTGELSDRIALYETDKTALRGISSTYNTNIIKAWKILATRDVSEIGKGLKTNNFAKNIFHPEDDNVTIDFHAVSIATNFRHTIDTVKSSSFNKKQYGILADAYREAGKRVGILGKQIQAITWISWRNLDKR